MIIDAHVHLPTVSEHRPYAQAKPQLLDDMKKGHVDYAIFIPDNRSHSSIGDVPTCLELVKDIPELFLVGTIDIRTQRPA